MTSIFWYRQDLRLADNPGLYEAALNGSVLAIYIFDESQDDFQMGAASRVALHHSLAKLNNKLQNRLNIYQGNAKTIIANLIKAHDIDAVYWNDCYEPWRRSQDAEIQTMLAVMNIDCNRFNGLLLWNPSDVTKSDGASYKMFTPYYKACLQAPNPRTPIASPPTLTLVEDSIESIALEALALLPEHPWHTVIEQHLISGEDDAQQRLQDFVDQGLDHYKEGRNYPAKANVSRLSSSLHFGTLSPNQVWYKVHEQSGQPGITADNIENLLSELGWREFSYYLLYHFRELPRKNFQQKFDKFPWETNNDFLKAWQRGQTGFPMVDAGMRELWQTGYMHNRVRMIVGSFLVKNLLIHWHHGAEWFWDCLVDADLANNSASWQWVAGSGTDASPFFRIFNPVTQSERFDPKGEYIRKFVPELANMPAAYLFHPWKAPDSILQKAGIVLGKDYPHPCVDLQLSRQKALDAYNLCR